MIPWIVIIISFLLDGILSNYLPYLVNSLSWFTPLFTLVSVFLIYPFYRKKLKNYFIIIIILGLLYDLFYTNLLFINAILFAGVGFLAKLLWKNSYIGFFRMAIYICLIIILYELVSVGFLLIGNMVPITLMKVIYKISHSLIINVIYAEIWLLIINSLPKKYKKISIN